MIGKDKKEDIEKYGHLSTIAGVSLAVILFVIMFSLANGFA